MATKTKKPTREQLEGDLAIATKALEVALKALTMIGVRQIERS